MNTQEDYNKREFFLEQGYVILKKIFSSEKIKNRRKTFIENSNKENEILNHDFVQELLLDKKLISNIKSLLKSEKILYFSDSSIGNKPNPLMTKNGWHNDARFEDESISYNQEYPILRIGIYFEDHKNFSGGLKIKKKSHNYFCFNWRAAKQNFGNLLKILFKKTRYSLSSLKNGKGINVDLEEGDVIVWNLRTHHCGVSRRLKLFPNLCLHPFIEKKLPLFLFRRTQYKSDRCALFTTFAKNDLENKNILGYVKNKMNVYKIKQLKNNPEVIDKCNRLGILIPEI